MDLRRMEYTRLKILLPLGIALLAFLAVSIVNVYLSEPLSSLYIMTYTTIAITLFILLYCIIGTIQNQYCRIEQELEAEKEERRQVEKVLQQTEERYHAIDNSLGAIGEGMIIIDRDHHVRYMNNRAIEWFGDQAGKICHESLPGFEPVCRECNLENVIDKGKTLQRQASLRDGRIYDLVSTPFRNSAGGVSSLCVFHDGSQRKDMERTRIRSESLAAITTLSAGLAHEFDSIHVDIIGYVELLLKMKSLEPKVRERLEAILATSLRAAEITQSLLIFTGSASSQREPASLAKLAQTALAPLRQEYSTQGVELMVTYHDAPKVCLNQEEIIRVIRNLITNSYHAVLGASEKVIRVETGASCASSAASSSTSRAYIRISETGIGIPEENLSQIFNPFFSTKGEHAPAGSPLAKAKGIGLGLSICETIIKNHNGEITVESTVNQGTTVTVWLPI
ncbi:MAG: PAS domain-containing protein [Planctomycetes bacterium]|nr:PAS domain-containing protein [Planctomycetota bacterium]